MGGGGTVNSRYISYGVSTSSAAQSTNWVSVAPALHNTSNDPGATVIQQYSNYVVRASRIYYTPSVGTTTTGVIFIAYVDNPEMIRNIIGNVYTSGDLVNIAQNMSTVKSGPIWQPLEVSMNRPPRRKMFSVDRSTPANAEIADRSVQGLWLIVTQNAPFSTVLGYVSEEYSAVGENLQPAFFTQI